MARGVLADLSPGSFIINYFYRANWAGGEEKFGPVDCRLGAGNIVIVAVGHPGNDFLNSDRLDDSMTGAARLLGTMQNAPATARGMKRCSRSLRAFAAVSAAPPDARSRTRKSRSPCASCRRQPDRSSIRSDDGLRHTRHGYMIYDTVVRTRRSNCRHPQMVDKPTDVGPPDKLTWTFNLARRAEWHDGGQPVNRPRIACLAQAWGGARTRLARS